MQQNRSGCPISVRQNLLNRGDVHAIMRAMARRVGKKTPKKPVARAPRKKIAPSRAQKALGPSRRVRPAAPRKNFKGLILSQVAALIGSQLENYGCDPVLTGRACAAIYAGASIKPTIIDFVVREYNIEKVAQAMEDIGFSKVGHRTFASKKCPYEVLLSAYPIAVGDDVVSEVRMMRTARGPLKLLMPTDCVRQRLSMYYRWGDKVALDDAVRVACRSEVDLKLIKRWSDWEWAGERFAEFRRLLEEGS